MQELLLVRYGEIFLKGLNRPYFMRALVSRVRQAAAPYGGKVWLHDARVFISDISDIVLCLSVFMVTYFNTILKIVHKNGILLDQGTVLKVMELIQSITNSCLRKLRIKSMK